MNKSISWLALGVGIVALLVAVVGGNNQPEGLGASGTRFPNGISADSTSPAVGEVRGADLTATDDLAVTDDATISGGSFTVTTTNAATSTASLGCIQTTATSTLTPVKLRFSIASTTLTTAGVTSDGIMAWSYGNCP